MNKLLNLSIMKSKNKYLADLNAGFENNDVKLIEDTLWDFYGYFYETLDTEEEEEYDNYETEILEYLYNKIVKDELPNIEIAANYDLINERLRYFIVQPYWEKLVKRLNPEVLNEKSKNDPGESNGGNLLTELNYLAEYIFFRYDFEDRFNKQFITKDLVEFIEQQLVAFSNLILLGRESTLNNANITEEGISKEAELIKKFKGNSLQKRKGNRIQLYEKVSKTIKIIDTEFSYLSGIQKIACEMYGIEQTSYSNWKNRRKENQRMIDEWTTKITEEESKELKSIIKNKLKLDIK